MRTAPASCPLRGHNRQRILLNNDGGKYPAEKYANLKHYLSVCAIFRNEAEYLREWIEFHGLNGVGHFYLYNNQSDDDYLPVLKDYVDRGTVTLRDWPERWAGSTQRNVYGECIERDGKDSRWIAFIDLDEFLFAPNAENLPAVLREYEGFPGIVVNWQIYGSSGLKKKPDGLVIENYTMKAGTGWIGNKSVKSIVDPAKALRPISPHVFAYRDGEPAVTENFEPVRIVRTGRIIRSLKRRITAILPRFPVDPYTSYLCDIKGVSVNKLRINHYLVKSEEEALDDLRRHNHNRKVSLIDKMKYYDRNDEKDDILLRCVPELKKRLSAV